VDDETVPGRNDPEFVAIELRIMSKLLPGYFKSPGRWVVETELDKRDQLKGSAIPTPHGYAGEHREVGIERVTVLKRKVANLANIVSTDLRERIEEILDTIAEMLKQDESIPDEKVSNVAGRVRRVADQLDEGKQVSQQTTESSPEGGQTEAAKTYEPPIPERRISVDVDASVVTVDGRPFGLNGSSHIKKRVAKFIDLFIKKDGDFVARPSKLKTLDIENQPPEVAELIDSQPGAGTRIPRDKIWRS